jgi:hypothetical protein
LAEHPDARLVLVDVLARIRARGARTDESVYASDYEFAGRLKALADRHQVAFVVVHHTRKPKGKPSDFVEELSGTNGLAGAADTIVLLRRARTEADAVLQVTGRDVEELSHALQLVGGRWSRLPGEGDEYLLGETARAILGHLRGLPEGTTAKPSELARALGASHEAVKKSTQRQAKYGTLVSDGSGGYRLPTGGDSGDDARARESAQPRETGRLPGVPEGRETAPETGLGGDTGGDSPQAVSPAAGTRGQAGTAGGVPGGGPAGDGLAERGDTGDPPARARAGGGAPAPPSEPALDPNEQAVLDAFKAELDAQEVDGG